MLGYHLIVEQSRYSKSAVSAYANYIYDSPDTTCIRARCMAGLHSIELTIPMNEPWYPFINTDAWFKSNVMPYSIDVSKCLLYITRLHRQELDLRLHTQCLFYH